MIKDSIVSAISEDLNQGTEDGSLLKEEVLRLHCLVRYLLEKNEQLPQVLARLGEQGDQL